MLTDFETQVISTLNNCLSTRDIEGDVIPLGYILACMAGYNQPIAGTSLTKILDYLTINENLISKNVSAENVAASISMTVGGLPVLTPGGLGGITMDYTVSQDDVIHIVDGLIVGVN